jgi:Putative zinc ribbon domain
MYVETSKGPFCQSCGMPLQKAADFGTNRGGVRVNDYCRFCYVNGSFTEPDLTVDGMIERCVDFKVRQSWSSQMEANEVMRRVIPNLKRWSAPPGA